LPIAVVAVAFSTIFEGVRLIDVSSTSPSIAVIAVTELYVAATLGVASVLEIAVAVKAVINAVGFAASSPVVLHVRTIGFWGAVDAAPVNVMVMVSAAMLAVVVMALVRTSTDPACVSTQPARVAGTAAHIDATVLVTAMLVGAVVVAAFGVHVTMTFVGVVPAEPTDVTCVAAIASAPCSAAAVT